MTNTNRDKNIPKLGNYSAGKFDSKVQAQHIPQTNKVSDSFVILVFCAMSVLEPRQLPVWGNQWRRSLLLLLLWLLVVNYQFITDDDSSGGRMTRKTLRFTFVPYFFVTIKTFGHQLFTLVPTHITRQYDKSRHAAKWIVSFSNTHQNLLQINTEINFKGITFVQRENKLLNCLCLHYTQSKYELMFTKVAHIFQELYSPNC